MCNVLGFLGTMILLLATEMLTALWQSASAETITVSQTGTADTQDIYEATLIASAGDTIRVAAGVYYGIDLPIDKSLTLIGAGPDSTIFVYGWENTIFIVADHVTIEGFTFHYNTDGRAAAAYASGMVIYHSPFIRGNRFTGSFVALELVWNAQPVVQYNEFLTPMGIHLRDNSHNIDARYNWWNTDERTSIAEKIWDGQDEDGLGVVLFNPWLLAPEGPVHTVVRRLSWGRLKRIHLPKEE